MEIRRTNLSEPEVVALLQYHLEDVARLSPGNLVHVIDVERLARPDIDVFAGWREHSVLAIGAIRHEKFFAEIKSMRTNPRALRQGAGRTMLMFLIGHARERGHRSVKLETGSGESYQAARNLYLSVGFKPCGPFAEYEVTDFSQFFSLDL